MTDLSGAPVDLMAIPEALREVDQWVCWRIEIRNDRQAKVPINAKTLKRAATNRSGSWSTFHDAVAAYNSESSVAGIGFVFTDQDPFVGIDLDDAVIDPDVPTLTEFAEGVLDKFGCYSEYSPSQRGIHIIARGTLPGGRGRKNDRCEIYDRKRFFTVTGDICRAGDIDDAQEAVDRFLAAEFPTGPAPEPPRADVAALDARAASEAGVPFDRFEALCENDRKFLKSWKRTRKDLDDTSPSGYDLALAAKAVAANWSDDEVVALLVAHRKKHGSDLKFDHPDYYDRTLQKAKTGNRVLGPEPAADKPLDRAELLQTIEDHLGIRIDKVEKFIADGEEPTYCLRVEGKRILLPSVVHLIEQPKFRAKVAAIINRIPIRVSNKEGAWDRLAQRILDLCEEIDAGEDSTQSGVVRGWIESYLEGHPPVPRADPLWAERFRSGAPTFDSDGLALIQGRIFQRFVRFHHGDPIGQKQLARLLRFVGCKPIARNETIDGKQVLRRVYVVPKSITDRDGK